MMRNRARFQNGMRPACLMPYMHNRVNAGHNIHGRLQMPVLHGRDFPCWPSRYLMPRPDLPMNYHLYICRLYPSNIDSFRLRTMCSNSAVVKSVLLGYLWPAGIGRLSGSILCCNSNGYMPFFRVRNTRSCILYSLPSIWRTILLCLWWYTHWC